MEDEPKSIENVKPQEVSTDGKPIDIPQEMEAMLQDVPEDVRPIMRSMIISSSMISKRSSPEMEIANRMTEEHMGKIIDSKREETTLHYADEKSKRRYTLLFTVVGVVAFIGTILLLRSNPDLLGDALKLILPLITGLAGGVGIGKGLRK